MTPEILRVHDRDQLHTAVAGALITTIVERQAATGRMRLVLTGGRTSSAVLEAVLQTPARSAIDWPALEIWWTDERYLPHGDPQRNDAIGRALLSNLPSGGPVLHGVAGPDTAASPEEAARWYQRSLPREGWDLVLLSLGEDGHIASIFPESPALHNQAAVLAVHGAPKDPPTRVTLSAAALSDSTEVWVMASGSAKSSAVRLALDPAAGPLQMPVNAIRGRRRTVWFVDAQAAERLPAQLGRRD